MKYPLLWMGAVLGVALHLAGIGWEAYLHAAGSTAAGNGTILGLANPSHLFSIAGLGLAAVSMGLDGLGRILVVVYAWRGESVRLISARKATARERRRYEEAR